MKVRIEFWKAKEAWRRLSVEGKVAYTLRLQPAMHRLIEQGVIMDAWGVNTDHSLRAAPYDFYAITKFPRQDMLEAFQWHLECIDWHTYFEETAMSGDDVGMDAVLDAMIRL